MGEKEKEKKKPTESAVPRLSEQIIRQRASQAFDISARPVMQARQQRVKPDLNDLRKMIEERLKKLGSGLFDERKRNKAIQSAIGDFIKASPDSPVAEALRAGTEIDPEVDYTERGGKVTSVKVTLPRGLEGEIKRDIKAAFAEYKKLIVEKVVKASEPVEAGKYTHVFVKLPDLSAMEFKKFATALAAKLGIAKKIKLPVKIAYNTELGYPRIQMEYAGKRKAGEIRIKG